ncbi:hypothetical protein Q5741_06775 [Paenibacillus sp. JX-17]|uniref:Sporulation membrane protein YtrI C-terminal domain-containing protein n=1 Tax=Paenibacillus lacisoli TaxID=3064525 RepID=A0ABT9CA40_9BACL|nr:hypothetical protein [Paenibacillus sp. JX-17]MDO7906122.1 hypothetical protein [Paenibacillus sp. JX-17]
MRVPPFSRFRPFMQLSAVFVLGMIIGGVVYNAVWHISYNKLWIENQDLKVQLQQSEEDIKTLRKYSKRQTVIKEIKIRAEEKSSEDKDPVAIKEIAQQMVKELQVLRGRDMFEIDTDSKLVRMLLDRKIYTVRQKEFSIQVKTMLVMEGVLQIWVDVRPYLRS